MHVSSKDTAQDGKTHLLTSLIEADGPFELCSTSDLLSGSVVSVSRTASGGIEVVTELKIAAPILPSAEDLDAVAVEEKAKEATAPKPRIIKGK